MLLLFACGRNVSAMLPCFCGAGCVEQLALLCCCSHLLNDSDGWILLEVSGLHWLSSESLSIVPHLYLKGSGSDAELSRLFILVTG
jgi:hypothetical protein